MWVSRLEKFPFLYVTWLCETLTEAVWGNSCGIWRCEYPQAIYCLSSRGGYHLRSRVRGRECMPTPWPLHLRSSGMGWVISDGRAEQAALHGDLYCSGKGHQSWSEPTAKSSPSEEPTAKSSPSETIPVMHMFTVSFLPTSTKSWKKWNRLKSCSICPALLQN